MRTPRWILYCCSSGRDLPFGVLQAKPLRYGSWRFYRLHVNLPIPLSLIEWADLSEWIRESIGWMKSKETATPEVIA